MRAKERAAARRLRGQGRSIREIAQEIKCAKSSISGWVRDITLTAGQIERLKSNQDRGRAKAANHPNSPKQVWARIRGNIIESAVKEIPKECSRNTLKVVGSALYWAEGCKSVSNMVNFSNSDPKMIILMMRFFRDVCNVSEEKFRGAVNIHPHLDMKKAVKFWSDISSIPVKQFHKTQVAISKASKQKKDTLPVGTFRIVISDVRLQSQIKGWIKGLEEWCDNGAVGAIG
jgi:transposase-like protein